MLNLNELRIGNWLSDFGDGPGKVLAIFEDGDILTTANPVPQPLECSHPIPLTPEILEKCGFEKLDDGENWACSDYKIYALGSFKIGEKDGRFFLYNQTDDDYYSWYSPEIIHLHKLQNLYFALADKELSITL